MSRRGPPEDLSPRQVAERWLDKRSVEKTPNTLSTYWYRIKKIVDYCEENGIERMQDLTAWELDEFDAEFRARSPQKVTIFLQGGNPGLQAGRESDTS